MKMSIFLVSILFLPLNLLAATIECATTGTDNTYQLVLNEGETIATIYLENEEGETELVYRTTKAEAYDDKLVITGSDNRIIDWDQEDECWKWNDPTLVFNLKFSGDDTIERAKLRILPGIRTQPNVRCTSVPRVMLAPPQNLECNYL